MEIAFRQPKDAAVEVVGLRVTLGDARVLRGVDMRVERGGIVALIGPNGSGKTTLLRCLLGLRKPDTGRIRVLGGAPEGAVLRRVGYVPQRLQLDRSFVITVREFLALRCPAASGWFWQPRSRVDDLLRPAVEELDVERLLDRPLAGLSGGQLQRVLICSSLLRDPELLLLDEPTAGVDTPGERDFYELIAAVHRRRALTVLLVSHDLSMVYRHASRVYALNGVICCEGTPDEVMNAESLKQAYGIHVAPYHHHHHPHPPTVSADA